MPGRKTILTQFCSALNLRSHDSVATGRRCGAAAGIWSLMSEFILRSMKVQLRELADSLGCLGLEFGDVSEQLL
jgi:hypothetical protein